jgi:8-oxo-dGTP diphosphatase
MRPGKAGPAPSSPQSSYPIAYVTTDIVLFTIHEKQLQVVLVERSEPPSGMALPGGFLQPDEDLERCARRELAEETGIRLKPGELEQLGSYGAPDRDPRYADRPNERVVTVAYWGIIPNLPAPRGGSDARRAVLRPVSDFEKRTPAPLAFDHNEIVKDALDRTRAKIEYETVATRFCNEEFTLTDLRKVYAIIWGCDPKSIDAANFRRKIDHLEGPDQFVVALGKQRTETVGRPAQLYRAGRGKRIDPPLMRPGR